MPAVNQQQNERELHECICEASSELLLHQHNFHCVMSSQQCLEGWIILIEDKQFWTVQFMSASALSYNIDKSVLMWSQLERIMCVIFEMMILDLRQTCLYQKCSMESWVLFWVSLFCKKPCKIIFSANWGKNLSWFKS